MEKNRIAAIIPIYNVEKYLEECLESVINQTMPFFEIILINDGSTDRSLEICNKYIKKYSNILLISQSNKGLACARNRGILAAKSDWIVFIDSDDYIRKDLVQTISDEIDKNAFDICYYNASLLNEILGFVTNENAYIRGSHLYEKNMSGMEYFIASYKDKFIVSACCAAYSLDFLRKNHILFPEGFFYEDNYFTIQTMLNAQNIRCISEQLYIRRCREGSIVYSDVTRKKCCDLLDVHLLIVNYIFQRTFAEEEIRFLKQYIANNYLSVSDFAKEFRNDEMVNMKIYNLSNSIIHKWCDKWIGDRIVWDDCINLLLIAKKDMIDDEQIVKIREASISLLKEKMNDLRLNDKEKNIGIYGMGKHTDSLFRLYELFAGKIECELFYVLTKKSEELNQDKKVYTGESLPKEFDKIIISSLIYQKEMLSALVKAGVPEKKIVCLYSNNESRDLTFLEEVLRKAE